MTTQPTPVALPCSRKVRVLHLIHTMAYGGVETAVLNWVRAIDRDRFDVHLVCFANPGETEAPFVKAADQAEIPVARIRWHRGKPVLSAARSLQRLCRQWKVDIVHAHNFYADVVTVVAALLGPRRFKTITTAYVWFDYRDWKRNLIQWLDARAMRFFDVVTAHCESTRIETIKRGFHARDVRTLICGFETRRVVLDEAVRRELRAALGAGDRDTVLINVARCYPEKAQGFLLECFARLVSLRPALRLWIAGVGPLEYELYERARQLGLGERARFLGFVPNLRELLALADVQVHPARIEGVPLAICEGMAARLPIVASAVGGLPEILDHGRNGALVPSLDHDSFCAAVLQFVDDPALARRFGAQAGRFIENDYSLRVAVRRVEATYCELVPC